MSESTFDLTICMNLLGNPQHKIITDDKLTQKFKLPQIFSAYILKQIWGQWNSNWIICTYIKSYKILPYWHGHLIWGFNYHIINIAVKTHSSKIQ